MSYRRKHVKSKIYKTKPKKSIFKRLWFWVVLLFVLIILSILYFLVFFSGVQVSNIVISGNQKIATDDIKSLVLEKINNRIFSIGDWEVNSKSIFLVGSARLSKDILNKFPTVESAKIKKEFMQTLALEMVEKTPVAAFCPSLDKATEYEKGDCYFIDKNGVVFENLSEVPEGIVTFLQAVGGGQVFVGEKVVEQNIMDLLVKAEKVLKDNFQIDLKEALVTSPLRLNVNTGENWQIYFDLSPDSDANLQITKLNLLLNGGISAESRKNLRYIDLRPKDRAIVCDNKTCGG